MNSKRKFFNNLAGKWDNIISKFDDNLFADNLKKLNIKNDDIILDIGAGTGVLLPYLLKLKQTSKDIFVSDISEKMLGELKNKNSISNVVCFDTHFIPVKNNYFDIIICFSSFPHFDNKSVVIKEFLRILKFGGRGMILHFDSSDKLNNMHCKLDTPVANDKLPKVEVLNKIITESGFDVIDYIETDDLYYTVFVKNDNVRKPHDK